MANQSDDVKFEHPQYEFHKHQVKLVNIIYDGIDTAKSLIYKSPNEADTDYYHRVENTPLNNFVERIVTTMAGQIFRKELLFEDVPDKAKDLLENVTNEKNINQFTKLLTTYGIRDGKAYVLGDRPQEGGDPYFSIVTRPQLINWRKDQDGKFTFAVIREAYTEDDGKFAMEVKEQYRVLLPDGNVEIYREIDGGWDIEEINTDYDHILLYELDIGDVPPLYDIAKMNANYLNAFSKKDQYLETAGSPIPFGKGLGIEGDNDIEGNDDDPTPAIVLGVNSMVLTDNTEASFEWVEMSGGSIDALQDDLERKAQAMAERALKLINDSLKTKTATEASIDQNESSSRLSDIAEDAEKTINDAYGDIYLMKYNQEVVGFISVNRDFNPTTIDTNLLSGLTQLQVSGNLSTQTLLESLVKHEIIELDDVEEELARIDADVMEIDEDQDAEANPSES